MIIVVVIKDIILDLLKVVIIMIEKIASTYVEKFDSVFISIFGVSPISDDGMNIMIIIVAIGLVFNLYCAHKLSKK